MVVSPYVGILYQLLIHQLFRISGHSNSGILGVVGRIINDRNNSNICYYCCSVRVCVYMALLAIT